jgi:hypothetical protein
VRLTDLASVLRSKNADPFITTCDVFIPDRAQYDALKASGRVTPETVAAAYGMPVAAVLGVYFVDTIQALKVSFLKYVDGEYVASGDLEDDDVSGMQRHVPLGELDVGDDLPEAAAT